MFQNLCVAVIDVFILTVITWNWSKDSNKKAIWMTANFLSVYISFFFYSLILLPIFTLILHIQVGPVLRQGYIPEKHRSNQTKIKWTKKVEDCQNEEIRNSYRRLKNELKRSTDKAKKEYLGEHIWWWYGISKNRTLWFNVNKEKGTRLERNSWDSNPLHQRLSRENNSISKRSRLLKIWKNYITNLYNRANRPENLEVEPEEEVDTDEKGP